MGWVLRPCLTWLELVVGLADRAARAAPLRLDQQPSCESRSDSATIDAPGSSRATFLGYRPSPLGLDRQGLPRCGPARTLRMPWRHLPFFLPLEITDMIVALASDHHGVALKAELVQLVKESGHEAQDCGPNSTEAVDYPDFAAQVAERVSSGEVQRGILICGSGVGMAIAANKVPGVRAAVCYDEITAALSREHNDANVLCLSGDRVEPAKNAAIVKTWLSASFEGGRHARRVDKIRDLEQRGLAS